MHWIAVDGIDGAGKTTCAQLIKRHYQSLGRDVRLFRHPSDRWTGRLTRRYLQGSGWIHRFMASIFFFLDLLISLCKMRGDAGRYDVFIFVRYLMTAAYLPEPLSVPGYLLFSSLLPLPDRLMLVDVEPGVALDRIRARDHAEEMFETRPMLEKIRERMIGLADRSWEILDNNGSLEDCEHRVVALLSTWEH